MKQNKNSAAPPGYHPDKAVTKTESAKRFLLFQGSGVPAVLYFPGADFSFSRDLGFRLFVRFWSLFFKLFRGTGIPAVFRFPALFF